MRLYIDRKNPLAPRIQLKEIMNFGEPKLLLSMDLSELKKIAGDLSNAYMTKAGYRRVLVDPLWKTLFNVEDRNFDYIEGHATKVRPMASLPCYQCGLILPAEHITIDHSMPQAGGENHAVLKVFRNLNYNLTVSSGQGHFAHAYANGVTQGLPTKAGREMNFTDADGKERRYTLSLRGAAVLSAIVEATSMHDVKTACMHSAFNLRPYCAKCNIKKSNTIQDLSWINE